MRLVQRVRRASLIWIVCILVSIPATILFAISLNDFVVYGIFDSATVITELCLAILAIFLNVLALWTYRGVFLGLQSTEPAYARPARSALFAVIGNVVVVAGLFTLLGGTSAIAACISGPTYAGLPQLVIYANCAADSQSAITAGAVVTALGTAVWCWALLGITSGYRWLAARYASPELKLGSVIRVIPYAGIVGSGMIFLETDSLLDSARSGRFSPYEPMAARDPWGVFARVPYIGRAEFFQKRARGLGSSSRVSGGTSNPPPPPPPGAA